MCQIIAKARVLEMSQVKEELRRLIAEENTALKEKVASTACRAHVGVQVETLRLQLEDSIDDRDRVLSDEPPSVAVRDSPCCGELVSGNQRSGEQAREVSTTTPDPLPQAQRALRMSAQAAMPVIALQEPARPRSNHSSPKKTQVEPVDLDA